MSAAELGTMIVAYGGPPPGTNPVLFLVILIPILAITAIGIGVALRRRGPK